VPDLPCPDKNEAGYVNSTIVLLFTQLSSDLACSEWSELADRSCFAT